jgi:hypothetical protein
VIPLYLSLARILKELDVSDGMDGAVDGETLRSPASNGHFPSALSCSATDVPRTKPLNCSCKFAKLADPVFLQVVDALVHND